MRIRHIAATATLAGLTTAGLISVTATPATATAADCMAYLEAVDQQSTARDAACITTETLARTASRPVALTQCYPLMSATGLFYLYMTDACALAAQK
jgi:hypothetical protein